MDHEFMQKKPKLEKQHRLSGPRPADLKRRQKKHMMGMG